jgi:polyribonucleotide nucleotidyltransferase
MFGKKKEQVEIPTQSPKPLPRASNKQIEPIEAEEVPEYIEEVEDEADESNKEELEFGDSGDIEEKNEELTDEIVTAYLKSHEQRLQNLEATLFRLKGAL